MKLNKTDNSYPVASSHGNSQKKSSYLEIGLILQLVSFFFFLATSDFWIQFICHTD